MIGTLCIKVLFHIFFSNGNVILNNYGQWFSSQIIIPEAFNLKKDPECWKQNDRWMFHPTRLLANETTGKFLDEKQKYVYDICEDWYILATI